MGQLGMTAVFSPWTSRGRLREAPLRLTRRGDCWHHPILPNPSKILSILVQQRATNTHHPITVQPRSILISPPFGAFANSDASPSIMPQTLTALAGRISSPRLAGVGPQKRHNALPGGQYAPRLYRRPPRQSHRHPHSQGSESRFHRPKSWTRPTIGKVSHIAAEVAESFSVAVNETSQDVI